jgi:Domain of unknown function (DUF4186)
MPAELGALFERLARSPFRARFKLDAGDAAYLSRKGLPAVLRHAADFVEARLAPAEPPNDGKQTPMRGHPVFVAQHATASCCRSCLAKWHGIPAGRALADGEKAHVLAVIEKWLRAQPPKSPPRPDQPSLL